MPTFSLPPIPAVPTFDSTPEQWTHYRWVLSLHSAADTQDAIDRQTAKMALMAEAMDRNTEAVRATAYIGQQILDQPVATPAPASGDGARVAMAALMTEGGADKPPAEVASAVLARVAAVDTMLGG